MLMHTPRRGSWSLRALARSACSRRGSPATSKRTPVPPFLWRRKHWVRRSTQMADATAALARYVGEQRGRELPEQAALAARSIVLDAVGCALAGAGASHAKAGYR